MNHKATMAIWAMIVCLLATTAQAADGSGDLILKNPFDNVIGAHFKSEGDRAYKRKKYVTALKHYRKAYRHAPENHRITYSLGKAHLSSAMRRKRSASSGRRLSYILATLTPTKTWPS